MNRSLILYVTAALACGSPSAAPAEPRSPADELFRLASDNLPMYQDARLWFLARGAAEAPTLVAGLRDDRLGLQTHSRILWILCELGLPSTLPAVLASFHTALDRDDPIVLTAAIGVLSCFPSKQAYAALDLARYHPDRDHVRYAVRLLVESAPIEVVIQKPQPGTAPRRRVVVSRPFHLANMSVTPTWPTIEELVELLRDERVAWRAEVLLTSLGLNPEEEKIVGAFARRPEGWWTSSGRTAHRRWTDWLARDGKQAREFVARVRCFLLLRGILSLGSLENWRGLAPGCALDPAGRRLGKSGRGKNGAALLGGVLTSFRRFLPTEFAPLGFTAWLRDDTILAVELNGPKPPSWNEPYAVALGEPAAKDSEPGGRGHEHWLYPARGLILHVQRATGALFGVTLVARSTLAEMRALPWLRDTAIRTPLKKK